MSHVLLAVDCGLADLVVLPHCSAQMFRHDWELLVTTAAGGVEK